MTSNELPATLLRLPGSKPKLATPTDPLTGLEGEMRAAIALAFKIAATKCHETVSLRQLLAAMIRTPCAGRDALCLALMRPEDRSPKRALAVLESECGMMEIVPKPRPPADQPSKLCRAALDVLRDAAHEAREMGDPVTGTQHVAIAMFRVRRGWYMSEAIKLGVTYFGMRLRLAESQRVKDAVQGVGRRNGQRHVLRRRAMGRSA